MITLNGVELAYSNMGRFDSDIDWIHPTVTIKTYEIIYVVEGEVHIREGADSYDLEKGDMLLLCPDVEHGGTRHSHGRTSFYWLHFQCSDLSAIGFPKRCKPNESATVRTLVELMHPFPKWAKRRNGLRRATLKWTLKGNRSQGKWKNLPKRSTMRVMRFSRRTRCKRN